MDYAGLIKRKTPGSVGTGDIVDRDGNVVGHHAGHQHFTIGQRRGVGVALGYPIYVVDKDAASNTVTVGSREDLAATGLIATDVNWLINPSRTPITCSAKIRYNAQPVPATLEASGENQITVRFTDPQHAVAPGQVVVCYDHDRVIAGGWIQSALR
jgi:tRNA-specific 2-thiouridylase